MMHPDIFRFSVDKVDVFQDFDETFKFFAHSQRYIMVSTEGWQTEEECVNIISEKMLQILNGQLMVEEAGFEIISVS